MPPKVSVILPFFNAENTLSKAINSILLQTYRNFELLLIDNNSTDKSLHIAKNFIKKDPRIQLLFEERQSVAYAMNKGIENSKGEYIARMDADDISLPGRLEKQLEFMLNNPQIGLCGSLVKYISHISGTEGFERFVEWNNSFYTDRGIELNRFVEIPIINPTTFFRRELVAQLGVFKDGDFPEDFELQLRYQEAGVKMAKLPEVLLEWHDYAFRLTRTDERYSSEAFFRIKAKYFCKWSEQNNPFHPAIWIWGAGRKTRQRATLLEKEGLLIEGFFDVQGNKTTVKPCLHYSKIPMRGKIFIVSMVGNYDARDQIREYLQSKAYQDGKDFILMA